MQHALSPTRVFLAEDSSAIRQRIGAMLRAAEMDVVGEGVSPGTCITGILAARPDVVVLDVHLEGGAGLEVLRAVRRSVPATAFVVFSNNPGSVYRKRYLAEGAASFLDKSTQFDQLAEAVAKASGH